MVENEGSRMTSGRIDVGDIEVTYTLEGPTGRPWSASIIASPATGAIGSRICRRSPVFVSCGTTREGMEKATDRRAPIRFR